MSPSDAKQDAPKRLAHAGYTRELFAADAITILHEAAGGALRDLDRLATSSLRVATRKKRKTIERDPWRVWSKPLLAR